MYKIPPIFESETDRCAICLRRAALTKDHVFPRTCLPTLRLALAPLLTAPKQPTFAQSAARFRTLCGDCNSRRLGKEADPHLGEFVEQSRRWQSASGWLMLPGIRCRPETTTRAVMGHLLAARTSAPLSHTDREMRGVVLGRQQPGTGALRLYYWLHPHDHALLMRDFVILHLGRHEPFLCSLLVFPRVGFMLTDHPLRLPRLDDRGDEAAVPYQHWDHVPWMNTAVYFTGASEETSLRAEPHNVAPPPLP